MLRYDVSARLPVCQEYQELSGIVVILPKMSGKLMNLMGYSRKKQMSRGRGDWRHGISKRMEEIASEF